MTDAELKVVVTAVIDDLRRGMAEVQSTIRQTTAEATADFRRAHTESTQALQGIQHEASRAAASFVSLRERATLSLSGLSAQIRTFGEAATAALAVLAGERAIGDIIRSTQSWAFEGEHLHHS